jgi:hypothetical protein
MKVKDEYESQEGKKPGIYHNKKTIRKAETQE